MASPEARAARVPGWVPAVAPLLAIAALIVAFLVWDPIGSLREVPPVEAISFERTVLEPGTIELQVRNDAPGEVAIAQVLVNDAYRNFTAGDTSLGRLEETTVQIPYPWNEGEPLDIGLVTSTGLVISHEVEAAVETPDADAGTFAVYALLGIYIGVVPVAIGLLWFPSLRRASKAWLGFFLSFTVGLLAFLLVDTVDEGLEISGEAGAALNGVGLFAIGALGAVIGLEALGGFLRKRGEAARVSGMTRALTIAYFVAAGIGLHNFGEGLAVGAALAAGEIALGKFLVLGFALHNTTEGLAIVSPLGAGDRRPALRHFVALGALAGVPTIAGAWLGGFAFTAVIGALAFGLAAGAIAQVIWTIGAGMAKESGLTSPLGALGFVAGLAVMYLTGLFAA